MGHRNTSCDHIYIKPSSNQRSTTSREASAAGRLRPNAVTGKVPSSTRMYATLVNTMHRLVLKYRSGEEIRKGDHVLFHGNPAEVELVACDPDEPEAAWYMKEFGGGVMILDPKVSGRTFISTDQIDGYEDLEFVS